MIIKNKIFLILFLAMALGFLMLCAPAISGDFTFREDVGKNEPLCQAVVKHMNEFFKGDERDPTCSSWDAISTFPGFIEPPWSEIDSFKNKELLFRLMKSSYADVPNPTPEWMHADHVRFQKEVDDFVRAGGRIRMWKIKPGLLNFGPSSNSHKSFDEQIIIEIGIVPARTNLCTNREQSPLLGKNYVMLHDLNGEVFRDISIPPRQRKFPTGSELISSHFFLYKNKPVLVNSEEIFGFSSGQLNQICRPHFFEKK